MNKITELLQEAINIVDSHSNDRDKGNERTMKTIVRIFNDITGHDLTEREGDIFMVCLKLVRMQRNPNDKDHYVDVVGYLGMAYESQSNEGGMK